MVTVKMHAKSFTSDDSFSYSIWKNMWGIRILQKEALVLVWLPSIINLIKLINESYQSPPSKETLVLYKMHSKHSKLQKDKPLSGAEKHVHIYSFSEKDDNNLLSTNVQCVRAIRIS